jgi:acetyltransferase
MRDLGPLLDPASIAVVGASPRGNRGLQVIENLQRFGSTARIYPVHPREKSVAGLTAYPDLASLPETCDFVAIALDADSSLDVLEQAIALGSKAGLLIASGFGEGGAGVERRRRLVDLTNRSDFLLCGPNCYGVLNVGARFAAYSGHLVDPLVPGNVALVMQSGALTHSLTDSAVGRGLALSHLITTGNELSVSLGEYLHALAVDDSVAVIGVFIEGLRDVGEFADAALEAKRRGKPVVALTVGRSELGQRAAMAHTGAVAGGGAAMSGLLRRCGVVQTSDLDEFRETLLLFSSGTVPTGEGVAIASISGGGTGLLADLAAEVDLRVPDLGETTVAVLGDLLPQYATVSNPLDVTGAAVEDPALMVGALSALQTDPAIGLVILALNVAGGSVGQEELYREQALLLGKRAHEPGAPVLAISLVSGPLDGAIVDALAEHDVVFLNGAAPALRAVAVWMGWHRQPVPPAPWRDTPEGTVELGGGEILAGAGALRLLADAGVAVPAYEAVSDLQRLPAALDVLTAPVVLKVEIEGLAHKTEVGGVVLGITTAEEIAEAGRGMTEEVRRATGTDQIQGFLVQQQLVAPAVECMVGVVRDPQVGLVLSVVPGGVLAELSGEALTTPVPVRREDVEHLLDSSPLGSLLAGYRGAPRADRDALVDLVVRFSDLVHRCGAQLAAAELNPVLALPAGSGAVAVDALFIKEESWDQRCPA